MQPKWFQRLDAAVGHVVWAVGERSLVGRFKPPTTMAIARLLSTEVAR